MALIKKRRRENVEGNFYVDSNCIDCGACYWIAPQTFEHVEGQSAVIHQPTAPIEAEAYRALLSCPVNSIGVAKDSKVAKATETFPYELEDGVFHCGFHSESSFGAASFFIKRTKGNVLVDSPRFVKPLEKKYKEMGGIETYLLSHKDDIADTNKYWEVFKGTRYLHADDVTAKTSDYENLMEGTEPFSIDDEITVIPVPGHTKGSVCYLYKEKFLFTGDHLAFSKRLNHLYAFKTACWYNFDIQIKSMEKLLDFDFEYVLPGHGHPFKASKFEMKESLKKCIDWMK
jgi:ferredoxin